MQHCRGAVSYTHLDVYKRQIQIDANGKLSLNRVAASNDLKLAANEIELNADTYAGRNATVTATDKTQVKESLAAVSYTHLSLHHAR